MHTIDDVLNTLVRPKGRLVIAYSPTEIKFDGGSDNPEGVIVRPLSPTARLHLADHDQGVRKDVSAEVDMSRMRLTAWDIPQKLCLVHIDTDQWYDLFAFEPDMPPRPAKWGKFDTTEYFAMPFSLNGVEMPAPGDVFELCEF